MTRHPAAYCRRDALPLQCGSGLTSPAAVESSRPEKGLASDAMLFVTWRKGIGHECLSYEEHGRTGAGFDGWRCVAASLLA
jgi:hypothetical protein